MQAHTTEVIRFHDGGRVERTAKLERSAEGDTLTFDAAGQSRNVRLMPTKDPGAGVVRHVPTELAVLAYALLEVFKQHDAAYGDRIGFDLGGPKVALYEEHPADKGTPYPHPGVTLLEAGGDIEPLPAAVAQNVLQQPSNASADGVVIALGLVGAVALVGAAALASRDSKH